MATAMVHVRVDEKTKEKAAKALAAMASRFQIRSAVAGPCSRREGIAVRGTGSQRHDG